MTHVTQTLHIDLTRARKDVMPNICHMRHRTIGQPLGQVSGSDSLATASAIFVFNIPALRLRNNRLGHKHCKLVLGGGGKEITRAPSLQTCDAGIMETEFVRSQCTVLLG